MKKFVSGDKGVSNLVNRRLGKKHIFRIAIFTGMLLLITAGFYAGYHNQHTHHTVQDILRKAYFIPIILAAFWYGLRGGIASALSVSMLYLPHVIFSWNNGTAHNPDRISEIVLYYTVGCITGWMAQKQKTVQEQYKQTSEELETSYKKLKEQTDLRIKAEEQLRKMDRLATLGELAAHLAHEIGNPLGSIKGAAEILCDDYTEDSDKYEFARILLKEIQRLDTAIQDFLEFGKPKALEFVEANLNQLVRTATDFIEHQCARQRISVQLNLDDKLDNLLLDTQQMKQALLNLLFNAIAAMPEGGTLILSTQLDKREDRSFAKIEIEDTGEGISESELDKIFEPFFTTRTDGTGLGLAIVRRVVEGHKGHISVESHKDSGTKFAILIPMQKGGESDA